MTIPSRDDWGDIESDLDTANAFKVFFGKSIAEAVPCIKVNPIESANEIRFMPPVPFRYYILAFRDYLLSDESRDDPDAPNCYLDLVKYMLFKEPDKALPVMPDLLGSIRSVGENQAFYDADLDIYGDFTQRTARILAAYEMASGSVR